jgi:hypothetical protein
MLRIILNDTISRIYHRGVIRGFRAVVNMLIIFSIVVSINMFLMIRFCSYYIQLPPETARYFDGRYKPSRTHQGDNKFKLELW